MRLKKSLLLLTVLSLAITFRCELNAESKTQPLILYVKPVSAICTLAVDGDTIIVNIAGVKERIRLIGVDTPERKHPRKQVQRFGKEAYNFTWRMAEGKQVRLEFDQNQRDRYKRFLAYVYL
jgi:micrococcal nuclease|tara:strand:- start:1917 stop:2282 length:366 start_codon:yes stop_codon:yes gene_type:complete